MKRLSEREWSKIHTNRINGKWNASTVSSIKRMLKYNSSVCCFFFFVCLILFWRYVFFFFCILASFCLCVIANRHTAAAKQYFKNRYLRLMQISSSFWFTQYCIESLIASSSCVRLFVSIHFTIDDFCLVLCEDRIWIFVLFFFFFLHAIHICHACYCVSRFFLIKNARKKKWRMDIVWGFALRLFLRNEEIINHCHYLK